MPRTEGRRERLSRPRVLDAAVHYADEHGLESLSMRKLGEVLGVRAMALYNHVSNKDDLLDGMVELVVAEIALPTCDDWRVAMRGRARSAHEVLLRHPWATALLMSRVNVGPHMLQYINATLGALVDAGFSYQTADHAWNAMDSYIYGFTLQRLTFPIEEDAYAEVAASYLPALRGVGLDHMERLTELVVGRAHDGVHRLDFGFELLLDGLEAMREG